MTENPHRICRTCRHWTPPTPVYYGTCHNTLAGLGAHIAASGDGTCKHHAFEGDTQAAHRLRESKIVERTEE